MRKRGGRGGAPEWAGGREREQKQKNSGMQKYFFFFFKREIQTDGESKKRERLTLKCK